MPLQHFVVITGPAGSGKSTLTGALGSWISAKQLMPVGYVNLDPGAEDLPYKPNVSVRKYVRLEEVMRRERLGPNGALIRSTELLLRFIDALLDEISKLKQPYVIVDTPGQMELFLFRDFGLVFTERLKELGHVTGVLVLDPTLSHRPQDLLVLRLLSLIVQLRFGVDVVPVLNKSDLLRGVEQLAEGLLDFDMLREQLKTVPGVLGDLSERILLAMENFRIAARVPVVSAVTGEGIEQLYDILHEIFCACGDLT
uniref:GTPase n=1 Tax=Thermofilum pendens TaxID=2269 RepID=A0A7C1P2F8_THEPE